MADTPEVTSVERAVGELRRSVRELHSRYGDLPPVRRPANDVERLDIDLADLGELPQRGPEADRERQDVVEIPSAAYDERMWHGGDDEGVGGPHG
jgi:hypothetical protein